MAKRVILLGMKRLATALAAIALAGTAVASATTPLPPPGTDFGDYGTLRVKEKFDDSKGIPIEGYTPFVEIRRAGSDEILVATSSNYKGTFGKGRYRVTSYWRTHCGPPGCDDPPSNYCNRTFKLARGDHNKVTVERDARGCSIVLAGQRPKPKKK